MPRATSRKRRPLSRERVVDIAISIADKRGLQAVTMRQVAKKLRVEAMSLYHHIKGKNDLMDGMVDAVFAEVTVPRDTDWQDAMRQRAASLRAALLRHRWAVGMLDSRKTPGPRTLQHHDDVIGCLRGAGFSLAMAGHAFSLLDSYIYGFVLQEVNFPFEPAEEIDAVAEEMLSSMPQGAFPHLVEFAADHVMQPGYAYANEFGYGLDVVLDGIARRVDDNTERKTSTADQTSE